MIVVGLIARQCPAVWENNIQYIHIYSPYHRVRLVIVETSSSIVVVVEIVEVVAVIEVVVVEVVEIVVVVVVGK
jgi:hypothetical protein